MNTKRHKPRIFYYYGNENGASSLESPVARSSPGEIVGITAESVYTKQRFLDLTTRALELFGTDKPTCLEVIALLAGKDGVAGTDTGITINSSLEDIQKYLQKVETTNYSETLPLYNTLNSLLNLNY